MIARTWLGVTPGEKADAYLAYLDRTGVKSCLETRGNLGVFVLRRRVGDRAEFLFISLWESTEAIRRFAGPEIDVAVYFPEDREFLLEMTPQVDHFDVLVHPQAPAPARPWTTLPRSVRGLL